MKITTENRNKLIAAAVLGGLAVVLLARAFFSFGGSAPSTPAVSVVVPTPVTTPHNKAAARGKAAAKRAGAAPRSLDPQLRYDWLKASEDTKYGGVGRNIFKVQAAIPEPEGTGATGKEKAEDEGPPEPPPPPPITLKFFGFASKPGEPKKVFLSQGEDVFIAREGEIVDRRYKVVQISPMSVEIEDEMNNHRQSIPLTQG